MRNDLPIPMPQKAQQHTTPRYVPKHEDTGIYVSITWQLEEISTVYSTQLKTYI
jgi:hypothetical protein